MMPTGTPTMTPTATASAGLPGDSRGELSAGEAEGLEEREPAAAPAHRCEQGGGSRATTAPVAQRDAEESGDGSHGAVVDDLGGALESDDGHGAVAGCVERSGDAFERSKRGCGIRALAEADEDAFGSVVVAHNPRSALR